MRTNLKVPFSEKDEAKKLGARWDAARKVWYVERNTDLSAFAKWMRSNAGATEDASSIQPSTAQKMNSEGITVVGSHYVPHRPVCNCLPWDVCDLCRVTALTL